MYITEAKKQASERKFCLFLFVGVSVISLCYHLHAQRTNMIISLGSFRRLGTMQKDDPNDLDDATLRPVLYICVQIQACRVSPRVLHCIKLGFYNNDNLMPALVIHYIHIQGDAPANPVTNWTIASEA